MRTLSAIDDEIQVRSIERASELVNELSGNVMTELEIVNAQSVARHADKYREMYAILLVLEEYLQYGSMDGRMERQALRNKLKTLIDAL